MKKIILTVAALTSFAFANAQDFKPTAGKISLEVNVTSIFLTTLAPGYTALPGGLPSQTVPAYGAKVRYFLADQLAVRLGLGWNSSSTKDPVFFGAGSTKVSVGENTSSFSEITFIPGFEKHFEGTDKLSPYIGAVIPVSFASSEDVTITTGALATDLLTTTTTNQFGSSSFGLGVLSGADYYISKSLFLGVELGLNFISKSQKDLVQSATGTGSFAISTTPALTTERGSNFTVNVAPNASFRLGYWF